MKKRIFIPVLSIFGLSLFSAVASAQVYQASVNTATLNSSGAISKEIPVSSFNFEKDGLKFNFYLNKIVKMDGCTLHSKYADGSFQDYEFSGVYCSLSQWPSSSIVTHTISDRYDNTSVSDFTSNEQMQCMRQSLGAVRKILQNPAHRHFLEQMKVDQIQSVLTDAHASATEAAQASYGPSVFDDPIFKIKAVLNDKGQCVFANEAQLQAQFQSWEAKLAQTKADKDALAQESQNIVDALKNINVGAPADRGQIAGSVKHKHGGRSPAVVAGAPTDQNLPVR